jgi:hypothetical protein
MTRDWLLKAPIRVGNIEYLSKFKSLGYPALFVFREHSLKVFRASRIRFFRARILPPSPSRFNRVSLYGCE